MQNSLRGFVKLAASETTSVETTTAETTEDIATTTSAQSTHNPNFTEGGANTDTEYEKIYPGKKS